MKQSTTVKAPLKTIRAQIQKIRVTRDSVELCTHCGQELRAGPELATTLLNLMSFEGQVELPFDPRTNRLSMDSSVKLAFAPSPVRKKAPYITDRIRSVAVSRYNPWDQLEVRVELAGYRRGMEPAVLRFQTQKPLADSVSMVRALFEDWEIRFFTNASASMLAKSEIGSVKVRGFKRNKL